MVFEMFLLILITEFVSTASKLSPLAYKLQSSEFRLFQVFLTLRHMQDEQL